MGNLSESPNSDLGISIASPLCHLFSSLFSSLFSGIAKKRRRRKTYSFFFSRMLHSPRMSFWGEKKNVPSKDNDREIEIFRKLSFCPSIEYLWAEFVDRSLRYRVWRKIVKDLLLNSRRVKWKNKCLTIYFFFIFVDRIV